MKWEEHARDTAQFGCFGGDCRMARGNLENLDLSGKIFKSISMWQNECVLDCFGVEQGQVAGCFEKGDEHRIT
jgi:hypothetical protein